MAQQKTSVYNGDHREKPVAPTIADGPAEWAELEKVMLSNENRLWRLAQEHEANEDFWSAFQLYKLIDEKDYEQAPEKAFKISIWHRYLHCRGKINLSTDKLEVYGQYSSPFTPRLDGVLDEINTFQAEAYVSVGKVDFSKDLGELKTLLFSPEKKPMPVYASPLSNAPTPSSVIAATPTTVATSGITKQM